MDSSFFYQFKSILSDIYFQNGNISYFGVMKVKKWILLLLVAGFIASHYYRENDETEKNIEYGSIKKEQLGELAGLYSEESKEVQQVEDDESGQYLLFVTTDEGKAEKAIVANLQNGSQEMEVAAISKEELDQFDFSKVDNKTENVALKTGISTETGLPIDYIIKVDKIGYQALLTKLFPEGIPLNLTSEMRAELMFDESNRNADSKEFLEIMKRLKETGKFDLEINQMIINTFSQQLTKPEVAMSLVTFIPELRQYLETDLTMNELLSIGINVMQNPIQEVHKLEIPKIRDQEVMEPETNWESL
jgi:hypothetical protein